MTMIASPQGCKVGWAIYDNEAEAKARSEKEQIEAVRRMEQGYDFGYQWPGAIQFYENHARYGTCWSVVTT